MVITVVYTMSQVYCTEFTTPVLQGRKQAMGDEGNIPGSICLFAAY